MLLKHYEDVSQRFIEFFHNRKHDFVAHFEMQAFEAHLAAAEQPSTLLNGSMTDPLPRHEVLAQRSGRPAASGSSLMDFCTQARAPQLDVDMDITRYSYVNKADKGRNVEQILQELVMAQDRVLKLKDELAQAQKVGSVG